MLRPAINFKFDMRIFEGLSQDFDGFVYDFFADMAFLLHLIDEIVILIRFQIAER